MALPDTKEKEYDTQLGYEYLLLGHITNVSNALRSGRDGMTEISILWTLLKKDIREPINEKLNEITSHTEKELKLLTDTLYNNPTSMGYPKNMSEAHTQQVLNSFSKPINTIATQRMLQVIIDRLDEMKLLLRTRREVPTGYLPRIKDDKDDKP